MSSVHAINCLLYVIYIYVDYFLLSITGSALWSHPGMAVSKWRHQFRGQLQTRWFGVHDKLWAFIQRLLGCKQICK